MVKSVGRYFQLNEMEMNSIIKKVKKVVGKWAVEATEIGISRAEQMMMQTAFNI